MVQDRDGKEASLSIILLGKGKEVEILQETNWNRQFADETIAAGYERLETTMTNTYNDRVPVLVFFLVSVFLVSVFLVNVFLYLPPTVMEDTRIRGCPTLVAILPLEEPHIP